MNKKHGYFQLINKADGTYVKVFSPENGGNTVNYNDIMLYLNKNNVFEIDEKELNHAILHQDELVKVSDLPVQSIDESLELTVSEDKMEAYVRIQPPCENGGKIGRSDVDHFLNKNAIKKGVISENIDELVKNRDYSKYYLIAQGKRPIEGHNAKIEYTFDINKSNKPKTLEDGTVDFKNLDIINHVNKDDLLATYSPVYVGDMGYDVYGAIIRPKPVKNFPIRIGKNVYLSDDKLEAYASVNGHVVLEDDKIVVHDSYRIEGDVDVSVGNIDFVGSVRVTGSVRAGYSIHATGDIEVMGIVEGARLIAGGSIILSKGIQGMNRGVLDAKGNIIARFIENTKVRTGGSLHTDSILHSTVYARGEINCTGRKGLISGGDLRAGTTITAKVIGSNMGTTTVLEVGLDPMVIERYNQLAKEIPAMQDNILKMDQTMNYLMKMKNNNGYLEPDKIQKWQKCTQQKILFSTQLKEMQEELDGLLLQIDNKQDGKVKVSSVAYPGVVITISNIKYHVRDKMKYVQFIREGADIKTSPYM